MSFAETDDPAWGITGSGQEIKDCKLQQAKPCPDWSQDAKLLLHRRTHRNHDAPHQNRGGKTTPDEGDFPIPRKTTAAKANEMVQMDPVRRKRNRVDAPSTPTVKVSIAPIPDWRSNQYQAAKPSQKGTPQNARTIRNLDQAWSRSPWMRGDPNQSNKR